MHHRHCTEFARAGAGLPPIEHGMPDPAGTGLSRRRFLLRAGGLALSVYGASSLLSDELAAGVAEAQSTEQRVLVSVFFSGGLDSIGILGPYGTGRYSDLRPTLRDVSARGVLRPYAAEPGWYWHPDAAGFDRLHRAGRLVVLPSVGYDDANQSHFTSRHYWEIGATDIGVRTGWLGRYLDQPGVGSLANPVQGLTLGSSLVPSLASARVPVAAVESPDTYVFRAPGVWEEELEPLMHDALAQMAVPATADPVLAQAKAAQVNASNLQTELSTVPATTGPAYPSVRFGERLRMLAHMLDEGVPIRVAGLIANGDYDTHAGQAGGFANNLPAAIASLEAFQADLEARGLADRVLTLVWSEFGRRPEENGSFGTDHGAAAVAFVMGTRAAGRATGASGQVGSLPDIAAAALDEHGNLVHDVDFRDLYGSVLEQWLGAEAEPIVNGPGGRAVNTALPLVRG